MVNKVLVLRTCDKNMKASYGDFVYPLSGIVEAPDWQPTAECGNGLHGFLWGQGDGELANFDADARWLVLSVDPAEMVNLGQKVKFRKAEVVFVGDRKAATDIFVAKGYSNVVGSLVTVGDYETVSVGYRGTATAGYGGTATAGNYGSANAGRYGTATAGNHGTATAGNHGTATAGNHGTATAGNHGTATAGYEGTATAGDYGSANAGHFGTATAGYKGTAIACESGTATAGESGTATAGVNGTLSIKWYDPGSDRLRLATAYVGENGIEPNVAYRVDKEGNFIKKEI